MVTEGGVRPEGSVVACWSIGLLVVELEFPRMFLREWSAASVSSRAKH